MDENYNDHIEILKNWANTVGVDLESPEEEEEDEEEIQKIESPDVLGKLISYPY